MQTRYYILTKIEGEYAYLTDKENRNEVFIALALLPEGADIGSHLKYEMMEYTLQGE